MKNDRELLMKQQQQNRGDDSKNEKHGLARWGGDWLMTEE